VLTNGTAQYDSKEASVRNSISFPLGESSYAAIDNGATLMGGPASQVASMYSTRRSPILSRLLAVTMGIISTVRHDLYIVHISGRL
jgi:hypothetical protein